MPAKEQLIKDIESLPDHILQSLIAPVVEIYLKNGTNNNKQQIALDRENRRLAFIDCFKGKIHISDDFDAPLEEMSEYM